MTVINGLSNTNPTIFGCDFLCLQGGGGDAKTVL